MHQDKGKGSGDAVKLDEADAKVKEEEQEEDAVHFEVDLLSFTGLSPSISMHIVTEQAMEAERAKAVNIEMFGVQHDGVPGAAAGFTPRPPKSALKVVNSIV